MAGIFTKGIDVSHWQGNIKWDKVAAAGVHFALLKASEAYTFKDSKFARNWKGCHDNGIRCGAYHFFRPNKDGVRQAENLLRQLDAVGYGKKEDLIPTIDCEDYDGSGKAKYRQQLQDCLDKVKSETGVKPIIYTQQSFWKKVSNPDFSSYPLWVVDISKDPPRLPSHWQDYVIWQYSHTGKVSGVSGNCDVNRFAGAPGDLDDIGA